MRFKHMHVKRGVFLYGLLCGRIYFIQDWYSDIVK